MVLKILNASYLFTLCLCLCLFTKTSLLAENSVSTSIEKELIIESDTASFDQKAGLIILKDNVLLVFSSIEFKSDEMTLVYQDTGGNPDNSLSQIREVSAVGNVMVQHKEQKIISSQAKFFPLENKISLMGNVKVMTGEKAGITAEKMSIDLSSGETNFVGKVSSSIILEIKN